MDIPKSKSYNYSIAYIILVLSTMVLFSLYLAYRPQHLDSFALAMYFPATIALLLQLFYSRSWQAVLAPLIIKISLRSMVFAFLYPLGVIGVLAGGALLLDIAQINSEFLPTIRAILTPKVLFMTYLLNLGRVLGEEYGWRGFLLEHLSHTTSRLRATIIVGVVWGLWHSPLLWILAQAYHTPQPILLVSLQLLAVFTFSFPFAYAYFQDKSIVPPMLLHLTWNLFNPIILGDIYTNSGGLLTGNVLLINGEALGGVLLSLLCIVWFVKKLPTLSSAGKS